MGTFAQILAEATRRVDGDEHAQARPFADAVRTFETHLAASAVANLLPVVPMSVPLGIGRSYAAPVLGRPSITLVS